MESIGIGYRVMDRIDMAGVMKMACWAYMNGYWYYFYYDGTMAHNTYIDGYHVNSSVAWVQ